MPAAGTKATVAAPAVSLTIAVLKYVAFLLTRSSSMPAGAITGNSFSLRTAVRESNQVRGSRSWVNFVRTAKPPELPVILL